MKNLFSILILALIAITSVRAQSNDAITERGLLTEIEDSGYPFFTLTVEFTERNFKEHFSINLEEVKTINSQILNTWLGKRVVFEYNTDIVNAVLDLKYQGKSVLPKDTRRPPVSGSKAITGILSNAEEPTQGDIPGEFYIKTEEEITEKFPFFITDAIVKLNGKTVVTYYQQRTKNTMVSIKLVE